MDLFTFLACLGVLSWLHRRRAKDCPECGEHVARKAKRCRFCGHGFERRPTAPAGNVVPIRRR